MNGDGNDLPPVSLSQNGFDYVWNDINSISNTQIFADDAREVSCHVPSHEITQFGHTSSAGFSSVFPLIATPEVQLQEVSAGVPEAPVSSLLADNNWEGDCGFNIHFEKTDPSTNSSSWTYSHRKDKLYVKKDTPCPIKFITTGDAPFGASIRATLVFIQAQFAQEVVPRCYDHTKKDLAAGVVLAHHVLRCESLHAIYDEDPISKQLSVVVQYENPQRGATESTYVFSFACWVSCSGGMNRRPIKLIFTLEHGGVVMGRRSLELRICACPARDRMSDEKMYLGIEEKPESSKKATKRKQIVKNEDGNASSLLDLIEGSPSKKIKRGSPPPGPYNVKAKDYGLYCFLKRMKHFYIAYNAMNTFAPQIKQFLLQSSVKSESSAEDRRSSEESE